MPDAMKCAGCSRECKSIAGLRSHQRRCEAFQTQRDQALADEFFASAENWHDRSACPHGLAWRDCDHCMVNGDMAYDARRESAYFQR